jgi:hypothetical protein
MEGVIDAGLLDCALRNFASSRKRCDRADAEFAGGSHLSAGLCGHPELSAICTWQYAVA